MKELIEKSKYLILIAVFSSLIASAAGFVWGFIKTLSIILYFIQSYGKDPFAAIALIEIMDIFLIATVLFIFAMGITFLKHLVEWTDPQGTLYFGIAVAAVSGALIAFGYYGGKD